MEMEMVDGQSLEVAAGESVPAAVDEGLRSTLERLATALEQVTERLHRPEAAAVRAGGELERRLAAAEAKLAALGADAVARVEVKAAGARKTVPASVTHLLAKQGVVLEATGGESMQAGALDAALGSLSVEQRIAVKAQLMRAGVLG